MAPQQIADPRGPGLDQPVGQPRRGQPVETRLVQRPFDPVQGIGHDAAHLSQRAAGGWQ